MKVLFDIGHPAHVHLFRNLIAHLVSQNIPCLVVTRDKEITNRLLEHYGIAYTSLTVPGKGLLGMLWELVVRDVRILQLHRKERFRVAMGTSVSIGHVTAATLGKVVSWNFSEDDDDVIPLQALLSYPTSTKVLNPDCLRFTRWRKKRVFYPSYHELAYLHPDNFTPDESVLDKYGLKKGCYVILRLVSLTAHHDVGVKGISPELKQKMLSKLQGYDIIESMEGKAGNKVEPWDMHHLLAFAKMIICDSQTMAAESMVLGVPSIRVNSFAGKISYLQELEYRFKLGFSFQPDDEQSIITTLESLLTQENVDEVWQSRRETMLSEKVDLTAWMIRFLESHMG